MNEQVTTVLSGELPLSVKVLGEASRPPLVLLHGYPDNHLVWLPVAERLAQRFFVIMPDVRGAGFSGVPKHVSDYRLEQLSADLQVVVDALIPGRAFHLAGHDWGSIQAWESMTTGPLKERIRSFTSLSGPCLDHVGFWMRRRLGSLSWPEQRKALRQLAASWYIMLFQLPLIPPLTWRLGVGRLWPLFLERVEGVHETMPNETRTEDGRHGVNLYRANFLPRLLRPAPRYADAPVQLIVPGGDRFVGEQLFEDLHQWVPELYRRWIDAGHWAPLSHPDRLAEWIGDFAEAVEAGSQHDSHGALRIKAPLAEAG